MSKFAGKWVVALAAVALAVGWGEFRLARFKSELAASVTTARLTVAGAEGKAVMDGPTLVMDAGGEPLAVLEARPRFAKLSLFDGTGADEVASLLASPGGLASLWLLDPAGRKNSVSLSADSFGSFDGSAKEPLLMFSDDRHGWRTFPDWTRPEPEPAEAGVAVPGLD